MNNFKVLSIDTVKQVVRNSSSTSSEHPGLGGAEYMGIFEDKVYKGNTIKELFENNNIEKVDSVIDLIKDGSLRQAKGKKYNSGNAGKLLEQGDNLEEYIKVILYFPPNLTQAEQISYRDEVCNTIHNMDIPTFLVNKNGTKSLVQRNFQGKVPLIKGQIHTDQSNESHCEIQFHNRAYRNIERDANGKIISAETSPIIDLTNADILSKLISHIEDKVKLKNEKFNIPLNIDHNQVRNIFNTPESVAKAASDLLDPLNKKETLNKKEEAKVSNDEKEQKSSNHEEESSIIKGEENKKDYSEPEKEPTQATESKNKLQDILNQEIKDSLSNDEDIDIDSLEHTLASISAVDSRLNIESETGGFKDQSHVEITLQKSKNRAQYEVIELVKALEAKKKEYEIIDITQKILENNKELKNANKELLITSEQKDVVNKKLEEKVKATVSKNIDLSIELDMALDKYKNLEKKISSKDKLLNAYREKTKAGFNRLNEEKKILIKANTSLKTENESLLSEVASYAEQNDKLSNEIKAIKEESEKEIKLLKETNESLSSEVKELKEVKDELKEATKLNQSSLHKINELLQVIADNDKEYKEEKQEMNDKFETEKKQMKDSFNSAKKQQNDEIAKQVKTLQSNYKKELSEKDEVIQKLKEELELFKNPKPKTPKA